LESQPLIKILANHHSDNKEHKLTMYNKVTLLRPPLDPTRMVLIVSLNK